MIGSSIRTSALVLAAAGLALSAPAAAMPRFAFPGPVALHARATPAYGELVYWHGRDHDWGERRGWDRDDDFRYRGYRYYAPRPYYDRVQVYYGEPVYRDTRVWQGNDGRYYCRRSDGTTGLIVGGAVGALLGRGIAGRGERTLGAILGAAGGALLGKSLDSNVRCN